MHPSVAAAILVVFNLSCAGPGSPGAGASASGPPGASSSGSGSPGAGASAPSPPGASASAVVAAGEPRVLLAGAVTCLGRPRAEHVFEDAEAFAAWWRETTCGRPETPSVDFAAEMVLAVEDADASNGCHGLHIRRAEPGAGGLKVSVERRVPGPHEMCTQQVVRPVAAVAVPRREGEVVFEWRTVTGP